jgi:hypothetical protein
MRARFRTVFFDYAWDAIDWFVQRLEGMVRHHKERRGHRASLEGRARRDAPAEKRSDAIAEATRPALRAVKDHADERTIRRIAEAQSGGTSSQESAARYARGENPGGMHHKAVRRDEGPVHPRPEYEEPQERKETVPGGERHIAVNRRGS